MRYIVADSTFDYPEHSSSTNLFELPRVCDDDTDLLDRDDEEDPPRSAPSRDSEASQ